MSPNLPHPFSSPTFSATAHAAALSKSQTAETLSQTLSNLRALRDSLTASLHDSAPPWTCLAPSLHNLSHALSTTQSAVSLRQTLSTLPQTAPSYLPASMSKELNRAAQLSANLSLLSSVREFVQVVEETRNDKKKGVLEAAVGLERARLAAEKGGLGNVAAVERMRVEVFGKHKGMLKELEGKLVDRVFGGGECEGDLVRAVDCLGGEGYSKRVLVENAEGTLGGVVRDVILKEEGFGGAVCEGVFERVRERMIGVLKALVGLVEQVEDEGRGMGEALRDVWKVMERLMVLFVQGLLGCSGMEEGGFVEGGIREGNNLGLSLLPSAVGRRGFSGGVGNGGVARDGRKFAWELERSPSYHDSFAALVEGVPGLTPSIYNLEVIFGSLQQFLNHSGRLLHSWSDKDIERPFKNGKLSDADPEDDGISLSILLSRAVDVFVKAIRRDVKTRMDSAFGNRAGTLLQPPTLTHSPQPLSPSSSPHLLPPLSQTQVLIDIIANCLTLCVSIPGISRRLGEIINGEVIKPFSTRAAYALNLAESWTDAGTLLSEIQTALSPDQKSSELMEVVEKAKPLRGLNGTKRSSNGGGRALRIVRKNPHLTTACLTHLYGKDAARRKTLRLLDESEWNAVVRLVANAKIVIAELDNCVSKSSGDWRLNGGVGAESMSSEVSHESAGMLRLRGLLRESGENGSGGNADIAEAIGKTRSGVRMLKEEVIERGLILLHAEVALRCFSEVVGALVGDEKRGREEENQRDKKSEMKGKEGDGGGGTTSAIFKATTLQLSDIERSSEDTVVGMNEYDEFGDRIGCTSDTMTDTEMDEYGFGNGLGGEQDGVKTRSDNSGSVENKGTAGLFSVYTQQQGLTEDDGRMMQVGRKFGIELDARNSSVKWNLCSRERGFVFCQADGGVAAGIRMAGELAGRGDRELALASRLFVDAAGVVAAECIGWPVVECDYSVVEGSSESAGECRRLLYAAGLM